jgi:hypothetical protein
VVAVGAEQLEVEGVVRLAGDDDAVAALPGRLGMLLSMSSPLEA